MQYLKSLSALIGPSLSILITTVTYATQEPVLIDPSWLFVYKENKVVIPKFIDAEDWKIPLDNPIEFKEIILIRVSTPLTDIELTPIRQELTQLQRTWLDAMIIQDALTSELRTLEFSPKTREELDRLLKPNSLLATKIDMDYKMLTNTDLSVLIQCNPNITDLNLARCEKVSDISALKGASQLVALNLESTNVSQLIGLEGHKNLTTLDLSYTQIQNKALKTLSYISQNLATLNLKGCEDIKKLSKLEELPNLIELDLSYTNIKNRDLRILREKCPRLAILHLQQCSHLNNLSDLKGHPNITAIDISSTYILDLSPLKELPQLTELDVSYTTVTQESIETLVTGDSKLKAINLEGCQNINDTDVEKLKKNYPTIEIFR